MTEPTPANNGVPVEVRPLWKEGFHQQGEKIQAFNEEPEIVGHHTVVEKNHHCFAFNLQDKQMLAYLAEVEEGGGIARVGGQRSQSWRVHAKDPFSSVLFHAAEQNGARRHVLPKTDCSSPF